MVASGVTRAPAARGQRRRLHAAPTRASPALAARAGHDPQRRRAGLWGDRLDGAVVAIGNAPTALFRLLEMVDAGAPRPAAVLGIPVGFIGAAESKDALAASDLAHLVVHGRRGGSAMTAAAVNAIARREGVTRQWTADGGCTASASARATRSWSRSRRPG